MTFYLNDDREYSEIIEDWVREFICTMDEDDDLYPGNSSGDAPDGVKIIFDGFGDLEVDNGVDEYQYTEGGNRNMKSFAVLMALFLSSSSMIIC